MEWFSVLLLGLALGMKHATDADHVVALTTIVSKQPRFNQAARIGAIWGVGHTIAIVIAGVAIIVFKLSIPSDLEKIFEASVGVMIIILGLVSIRHLLKLNYNEVKINPTRSSQSRNLQSLIIGLVHGLAGSAAVALLVLSSIESTDMAVVYLLIFGIGTIIGMMLISSFISTAYILTKKSVIVNKVLCYSTAVFSICFGVYYIYLIF